MLEPYATKMPKEAEVMEFYDNELENIRRQLQNEYGEEFVLSYRITDMNEFSSSTILAYNVELNRYNLDMSIEDIIILEVEYTAKGNGKSGILSDGFFYPRVTLLKLDGSWTLGESEGLPKCDTKELALLFGIDL